MSHDDRHEIHARTRELLDDYVDGALTVEQQARVEAHLHDCLSCRAEADAVRALVDAARALPSAIADEHDSWPDLEKRIRQRPVLVVAGGQPSSSAQRLVRPRWPHWVFGGAAAAAVLLLLTVVWLARRDARSSTPTQTTPIAVQPTASPTLPAVVRGLEEECMGAGKLLQASLSYEEDNSEFQALALSVSLGVGEVDRSIAETRAALEERPNDTHLLKQLTMRYQQKLDLLLGAMRRVEDV